MSWISKIKHAVGRTFFDFSYGILYRERPENYLWEQAADAQVGETETFRFLAPTLRYWYADPIPYSINNEDYVFCEVFDRKKNKGFIGVSGYDTTGKLTRPRRVIEEPFHLSYPLLFEHRGKTYMMPECSEAEQLRIYEMRDKCTGFELVRAFNVNMKLVDTVVYVKGDTILLLACEECPGNGKKTRLHMYQLEDIYSGELTECMKPAKEYTYDSRNGGALLAAQGSLYRIVQESTPQEYGRNIVVCRIEEIASGTLRETRTGEIFIKDIPMKVPKWYRKQGTHTYGCCRKKEVCDISFNRFHVGNLFYGNYKA